MVKAHLFPVASQIFLETNVAVESDPNIGQIKEKKDLERRNKLGAKILKAKLQGKTVCSLKIICGQFSNPTIFECLVE